MRSKMSNSLPPAAATPTWRTISSACSVMIGAKRSRICAHGMYARRYGLCESSSLFAVQIRCASFTPHLEVEGASEQVPTLLPFRAVCRQ